MRELLLLLTCMSACSVLRAEKKSFLEDQATVSNGEVSSRPEILLLGDSIRLLYCEKVEKDLKDRFDVRYPKWNTGNTQTLINSLAKLRGLASRPKVVQFNCGHWDASHWDGDEEPLTSLEEYAKNIRLIIVRLKKYYPNAKIVFATTTPMNPDGSMGRNRRTTAELRRYNDAAVRVARAEGVQINDLFALTESWPTAEYADYCHFTAEAAERLGSVVAERLEYLAGDR